MNKKTENECNSLIKRYKNDSGFISEKRKIQIRNKLYCIMSGDIQMWIKSILKKWGRYEKEGEILSISFDTFLFCLERYKIGFGSFQGHFFKYSRYYLLMKYGKEEREKIDWIPVDELKEIFPSELQCNRKNLFINIFINLLTLTQFRDCLTDDIKFIWDDAALSLSESHMERKEQCKKSGMSTSSYAKIKGTFINQIKLILNIE